MGGIFQIQRNVLLENPEKNIQLKSCFSKASSNGQEKLSEKQIKTNLYYHEEKNDQLFKRIELGYPNGIRRPGPCSTCQHELRVSDAFGKAVNHSEGCVSSLRST